jgi:2-polyprenyl-3-methyl-5-hydroxy-6-metoxy-1,4-benzoquinol methylase
MKTYQIKAGYIHKPVSDASTVHTGYWTSARIYASGFHQHSVYRYAHAIATRREAKSIMDIGCGPGTKLRMLYEQNPNRTYIGVDLPEAIEYCRRTHKFGNWYADDLNATHEPAPGLQADLIICSDVIEHIADPDNLLGYIKTRLAPDGRVVLSTPERDILNGVDNFEALNPHHVREWNAEEIAAYLREWNFEIEDHQFQYPVRLWPNRIFFREVVLRALHGYKLKYNQVLLLRSA